MARLLKLLHLHPLARSLAIANGEWFHPRPSLHFVVGHTPSLHFVVKVVKGDSGAGKVDKGAGRSGVACHSTPLYAPIGEGSGWWRSGRMRMIMREGKTGLGISEGQEERRKLSSIFKIITKYY